MAYSTQSRSGPTPPSWRPASEYTGFAVAKRTVSPRVYTPPASAKRYTCAVVGVRSSASHTAPSSVLMANDHGLGRRAWSLRKPGSSVDRVPAAAGVPAPTRYTPAKSASPNDTNSWPALTATPRASPSHTPALVVSAVSVAGEPHANDLSPEPVPQPAPAEVVM